MTAAAPGGCGRGRADRPSRPVGHPRTARPAPLRAIWAPDGPRSGAGRDAAPGSIAKALPQAAARSRTAVLPFPMPSQATRGRPRPPKAPAPWSAISKGATERATSARAASTAGNRSTGVAPMKASVRCRSPREHPASLGPGAREGPTSFLDLLCDSLRHRQGHEATPRWWIHRPMVGGTQASTPCSSCHLARSSSRTRRASSTSRQPTTSVAFSSSSL